MNALLSGKWGEIKQVFQRIKKVTAGSGTKQGYRFYHTAPAGINQYQPVFRAGGLAQILGGTGGDCPVLVFPNGRWSCPAQWQARQMGPEWSRNRCGQSKPVFSAYSTKDNKTGMMIWANGSAIWFRHLKTDTAIRRQQALKEVPFVLAFPDCGVCW